MNTVSITVPLVPPRLNVLLRMHWAKQREAKREWCEWLCVGMNDAEKDGQRDLVRTLRAAVLAGKKIRFEIEVWHSRSDDPDNLMGRAKLVLDAAKYKSGAGLIFDDTQQHVELVVTQVKCKRKEARTVIRVSEAANGNDV